MNVYSVDFEYDGAIGNVVKSNVHVLADKPESVLPLMVNRFPFGLKILVVAPIRLRLPIILDEYYREVR